MRIKLSLSPNTTTVGFDYQQKLIGVVHKWLGTNSIHDNISLYCFSSLFNGKIGKNGYEFHNGAIWILSFYDCQYINQIIKNIFKDATVLNGMSVTDIDILEDIKFDYGDYHRFSLLSPIFIKRRLQDGNVKFYLFDNEESNKLMVETLKHKMQIAGLEEDESLDIKFDLDYQAKKTKLVTIHNIKNKCNMCPVLIKGKPETISFAYDVGIGNLTGSGFGVIEY